MALVGEVQAADLDAIFERQQNGGYRSSLVRGEQEVFDYMRRLFPDWKARGLVRCLHEHQGGFAFNAPAMFGLAGKAEAEGVRILSGVEVQGFERADDGSVKRVLTNRGPIEVETVVVGVGPWIKNLWGWPRARSGWTRPSTSRPRARCRRSSTWIRWSRSSPTKPAR
jgi:glycine/D-amino acid oxidase-like deaminating enzyme